LKELGKENITDEVKQKINQALEKVPVEILKEEILNAPVWVRNEVLSLNN
jgi:flagellar basal body-associated protein FliL